MRSSPRCRRGVLGFVSIPGSRKLNAVNVKADGSARSIYSWMDKISSPFRSSFRPTFITRIELKSFRCSPLALERLPGFWRSVHRTTAIVSTETRVIRRSQPFRLSLSPLPLATNSLYTPTSPSSAPHPPRSILSSVEPHATPTIEREVGRGPSTAYGMVLQGPI